MVLRHSWLGWQGVVAATLLFLLVVARAGIGQRIEPSVQQARDAVARGQYEQAFAVLEAAIVDGQVRLEARVAAGAEVLAVAQGGGLWEEAAAVYERCLAKVGSGSNELYRVVFDGLLRAHREAKRGLAPLLDALQSNVLPFAVGANAQLVREAIVNLESATARLSRRQTDITEPTQGLGSYDEMIDACVRGQSLLREADELYREGAFDSARVLYLKALDSSAIDEGGTLHAALQLGRCWEAVGRAGGAEDAYRAAWELLTFEDRVSALRRTAEVYLKAQEYDDGLRLLRELAASVPTQDSRRAARVLEEAATVCVGLQRYDDAIGFYQSAARVLGDTDWLDALQEREAREAPIQSRVGAWADLLGMMLSDAVEMPERLSGFVRQFPHTVEAAYVYGFLVEHLLDQWRPRAAQGYCEKLLQAWPGVGAFGELKDRVREQLRTVEDADRRIAELRVELDEAQDAEAEAKGRFEIGQLLVRKHDFASAFQELHTLGQEMPLTSVAPQALSMAGQIAETELGEREAAEGIWWRLLVVYPETEFGWPCVELLPELRGPLQ